MRKSHFLSGIAALTLAPATPSAEPQTTPWVNMYGVSGGLIDMPTAEVAPV
jgi:hypothetical protein